MPRDDVKRYMSVGFLSTILCIIVIETGILGIFNSYCLPGFWGTNGMAGGAGGMNENIFAVDPPIPG
jgi:hypothetical protein